MLVGARAIDVMEIDTGGTGDVREEHLRRLFGAQHMVRAVHKSRDRARERALGVTRFGVLGRRVSQLVDLVTLEEGEALEVPHHVAIFGVQPELIEAEGRGPL